jgi:imidazolonepropionase-like amidohydrolase
VFSFLCSELHTQNSERTLLLGATAHIGNGQSLPNAAIGIESGKISFVADAEIIKIDTSTFKVIYLEGKHIYPGIIALNTQIGLKEIDQIRQSHDFKDVGDFNPSLRSLSSYNSESKIIPTLVSNGILFVQSCPKGGYISGRSSVLKLDGLNWEDSKVLDEDGMHLNFPVKHTYTYGIWKSKKRNKPYKKWSEDLLSIYSYFDQAKAYLDDIDPEHININFEAFRNIFNKTQNLYIHAQEAQTILSALMFIEHYKLNGVIVGGQESWMVLEQLKKAQVPVIIDRVHRLPNNVNDPIDIAYCLPKKLFDANILFAIAGKDTWRQRNLPFHAGTAIAYGLSYEEALKSISLNPAKILGIEKSLGSLEEGKEASLIISDGDVFDPRYNKNIRAMIKGQFISLENHQEALYKKYLDKFGLD